MFCLENVSPAVGLSSNGIEVSLSFMSGLCLLLVTNATLSEAQRGLPATAAFVPCHLCHQRRAYEQEQMDSQEPSRM